MDASGADKLILLVQTNQVLYDRSAAEYKVKDALEKGDIWQIGVDIAINSGRTTDLRCRFSFLVSRWRCDPLAMLLSDQPGLAHVYQSTYSGVPRLTPAGHAGH